MFDANITLEHLTGCPDIGILLAHTQHGEATMESAAQQFDTALWNVLDNIQSDDALDQGALDLLADLWAQAQRGAQE